MTAEPVRTVSAVLERFGSDFGAFAAAFNEGQYVLWLGSGISRERVPSVDALLARIIESLRLNIDTGDGACSYRAALHRVLSIASLTPEEQATIDLTVPFSGWSLRARITGVLADHYSKVLGVRVEGKAPDYLVWEVLDVTQTYGSPDIEPDVEHYCVALLMLEGLVDSAVTTNWDGLVEKALHELTPAFEAVARVIVRPEDFHLATRPVQIIKLHGCAVRAREDASYRPLLIGRMSQISKWATQSEHRPIRKRLESLYAERPTLMVGLSAQDANLQYVFGTAVEDLARPWSPTNAPAVVFSEEALHSHHENVLEITYGADYDDNATAICASAVLGSYGKPTLLALVLSSLTCKLKFLSEQALRSTWSQAQIEDLTAHLDVVRDKAANSADPNNCEELNPSDIATFQRDFIARLIDVVYLALTVFRTGHRPSEGERRYQPLSERPITQAIHNADFPSMQFGRLGIALALIGRGLASRQWSAVPGDRKAPGDGVVHLVTRQKDARVLFVKDAATLAKLELDDSFDVSDEDALIIIADEEPPISTRSPKPTFGRNGKVSGARFNVASSIADTASADDLFEAFKLAGGF